MQLGSLCSELFRSCEWASLCSSPQTVAMLLLCLLHRGCCGQRSQPTAMEGQCNGLPLESNGPLACIRVLSLINPPLLLILQLCRPTIKGKRLRRVRPVQPVTTEITINKIQILRVCSYFADKKCSVRQNMARRDVIFSDPHAKPFYETWMRKRRPGDRFTSLKASKKARTSESDGKGC